jgi:hypothetical protein
MTPQDVNARVYAAGDFVRHYDGRELRPLPVRFSP